MIKERKKKKWGKPTINTYTWKLSAFNMTYEHTKNIKFTNIDITVSHYCKSINT